jgi:hypothetical protein
MFSFASQRDSLAFKGSMALVQKFNNGSMALRAVQKFNNGSKASPFKGSTC